MICIEERNCKWILRVAPELSLLIHGDFHPLLCGFSVKYCTINSIILCLQEEKKWLTLSTLPPKKALFLKQLRTDCKIFFVSFFLIMKKTRATSLSPINLDLTTADILPLKKLLFLLKYFKVRCHAIFHPNIYFSVHFEKMPTFFFISAILPNKIITGTHLKSQIVISPPCHNFWYGWPWY